MHGQVKQVFMYIMMIIVVGFIVVIGVRSFGQVNQTKCDAERVLFLREMRSAIEDNVVWGREEIGDVASPCDYGMVCMVDARLIQLAIDGSPRQLEKFSNVGNGGSFVELVDVSQQRLMDESVTSGIEMNVFLIRRGRLEPVVFEKTLHLATRADIGDARCMRGAVDVCPQVVVSPSETIPTYALCVPSRSGRFSFEVLGEGRSVLVKPV